MSARPRLPLLTLLAQAALVFVLLYGWLDGRHRDFHVPLQFSHDALEYLMQVKGTIDHGWWWFNSSLSAPGRFDQVAYPSNTNVDQAIVWIVHLFTADAPLCLNLSWMILVALSAPIATACLMALGISRPQAYVAGVLYALSPYAIYRQLEHFALVVYLVPIPCTAALLIVTGRLGSLRSRTAAALLAGCVLLGFDYVYYAFFGCFVILTAALVRAAGDRDRRALSHGAVFIGAIVVATAVNLAPTLAAWGAHGQPLVIPEKTAAEAEVYGLKIRQLVSPTFDHRLAIFRRWTDEESRAYYPAESENARSRLGLLETAGFLLLLAAVLAPRLADAVAADAPVLLGAARLTLAAVLLGTVGGFGSLFSLLVTPEIRAYNRIAAFIGFFAWVAVCLALDRIRTSRAGISRIRAWAPALALLLVGVWDQAPAAAPLNRTYAATRDELAGLRWFVGNLEKKLPPGALVFQLPVTTYLNDNGHNQMLPYDHIKPYIVSRTVHWSYPALDDGIVRWQQSVGRLTGRDLTAALDARQFAAIVVDRYGYADHGEALLAELGAAADPSAILAESGRYVALDLQRLPRSPADAMRWPDPAAGFVPVTIDRPACSGAEAGIDRIGTSQAPWPDAIVPAPAGGAVTVRGWAIDARGDRRRRAGDVDVVIDGRVFPTFHGVDRADVAERLHDPDLRESGFLLKVPAALLKPGPHALSARVLSADRRCVSPAAEVAIIIR